MARGRQAQVVKLSKKERNALEALVRRSTAPQRDVVPYFPQVAERICA
jgi:hypothetical protein